MSYFGIYSDVRQGGDSGEAMIYKPLKLFTHIGFNGAKSKIPGNGRFTHASTLELENFGSFHVALGTLLSLNPFSSRHTSSRVLFHALLERFGAAEM